MHREDVVSQMELWPWPWWLSTGRLTRVVWQVSKFHRSPPERNDAKSVSGACLKPVVTVVLNSFVSWPNRTVFIEN